MKDDISKYRMATMFAKVIAEGDSYAEVAIAGAIVGHDGLTVMVPPGEAAQDTVDQVVADLKAEFGREPT